MDDLYSCDPTGEVTAGENTITEEQPGNDVSALPESAEHVIAADQEEAFSSTDYSFPNIKNDSDPGEYADERYDEPYYEDADYSEADYDNTDYSDADYDNADYSGADYDNTDYSDADYDDAYYSDEDYDDADYGDEDYDEVGYADDRAASAADDYIADPVYKGPVKHSYDPNGAEDERPVYGSYYGNERTEKVSEAGDREAQLESEPPKGPYTSKYDAYRFKTPENSSSETSRNTAPIMRNVISAQKCGEKKKGFSPRQFREFRDCR